MKVLITGSQGKIGRVVTAMLLEAGYQVRSLDRAASGQVEWEHIPADVLDGFAVRQAIMGCDAVVHLAAIPNDRPGSSDSVFGINVMGTWNALQAAAEAEIKKFVFFSSAQAVGIWAGRRGPDYLPVNDSHPCYPVPAYGLSKRVGEEMCESFTRHHGMSTYCLRPCIVYSSDERNWGRFRNTEWARRWMVGDYYSYIEVHDVARAVLCCLEHSVEAHHGRYLLAAANNILGKPTSEILKEDYPEIPWIAPPDYLDIPDRGLVDTSASFHDLGWKPEGRISMEEG